MHNPAPASASWDADCLVIDDQQKNPLTLTFEQLEQLLNKAAEDKLADILLDLENRTTPQ